MNFFLFILSVGGLCYGLESNHHYKYKYSAYFKSGIPDDGNEEVGMAMKAILDVFAENNDGIAIFKLSDVSTFNLNEDLGEVDFTDKRFHHLENEDLAGIFEQPFRVNLRDSDPFAIEYAATEHRWLSNVRKGIASMLKNEILKGNFVTQVKDSIPSLFHQGHLVNNFYVDEETIFGICEAKYNIHRIPDTMFTGSNELTPTRHDGAKKDLWHVTRTIDFDKCTEIVALHVHTTNNRRHKHKKLKFTRTSVSSYVLRGSPGHFDLYSVLTEGATTYPVSLFNENEEAQSSVKQKLVLIDEGPSEVLPELGANLKHSTTWMHEVWSPFQRPKEGKPHPWIVYSNENKPHAAFEMFGTKDLNDDQIALAKTKIIEIIKTSSRRLADTHHEAEHFPPEAISESLEIASYFFRFLKKKDYLKIFDHIFEGNVGIEKQLVINAAAATGSYNAIEAIMDYVEENKIGPSYLFTTLLTLTRNSYGTLNVSRLMDYLLRSEEPSEYLLNFAHYLSEYCIHKVHNYIPIAGDAECDSSIINTRFIPYLKEIIYNEELTWERGYAVKVLTVLRSGFTFEIVSPLIDGRMNSSVALKAMAVRAFENWSIYPEMTMKTPIIDLLTDVYSDVSQDLYVRTAALLAIISWEPNTKFWYNLALKTWNDPSNEFASFASSLIKTYAEDNLPSLQKQRERAAYALKFAKPPSKSSSSYNFEFYKAFFNRQEKFSLFFSMVSKTRYTEASDIIFNILTNIEQLSLFKIEKYRLYGERVTNFNETVQKDHSNIPHAMEFLEKLYNEMHFEEHPIRSFQKYEVYYEILNDVFVSLNSLRKLNYIIHDPSYPAKYHVSQYFNLMDKSDYHTNELGLPLYTYSTLPAVFCFTHEQIIPPPGFVNGDELQLRFSSVYSSGISVFLPWSHQYSTAMVRTNLELKIPIRMKEKRTVGTEGPLRISSKTSFEIPYKKKFPLFHLSSTPMTITYDTVQILKNEVTNFEVIKKSNIKEKLKSEVNPHTGIKYDLVMRADTPTSFGLRDFLQFPDISFRVWSLDFHLDLEESETKELLVTHSSGILLNSDEYEGGDFDHNSNESRKEKNEISFHDNFGERSRKITNLIKTSNKTNYIPYWESKLDFIGKFARHFETFNAVEMVEGPPLHYYRFETIGFTSAGPDHQQDIFKSVCLNLHSSHYSGFDKQYYDSNSALPNHEIKEMEFEVLRGCSENIFTAKVVHNYSEERSNKTKEYCKTNYGEEKCYVEDYNLLLPDDIRVTIHNENNTISKNVKFSIQSFLEFFSVKGFDSWISEPNPHFNIRRNPYHGHWDLYLNKESEDVLLTTFSESFLIKNFLNYPSQFTSYANPFIRETVQKCTLKTTSVETFDGLNFNYELSNCWTLVSETEGRVFLIRKPQGESSVPDFKYFKFDKGTVIDFSNNELKINGSIINSSDTVISYSIYKRGNTYLIFDIYGEIEIIVSKNKIEYYEKTRHLKSNGICGSDYGKTIPQLIGPKKCVYDDAQMFTASWTGESENCDSTVLKEYRKGVEEYQTKCKPDDGQQIESVLNPRCLFFGWKILTLSDHSYCISANPMPFCSIHCDIKKVKTVEMAYKCWPKEKAPLRLRSSIENNDDVITDSVSADPYFYEFSSTEMAKICKQF